MNGYLIPANTKKSMLIFNVFTKFDLILFASGLGVTILLLMILPLETVFLTVVAALPAMVCGFLVLPVPNYHNIRTIIVSCYIFYTTRQKFIWRGWCVLNEPKDSEE